MCGARVIETIRSRSVRVPASLTVLVILGSLMSGSAASAAVSLPSATQYATIEGPVIRLGWLASAMVPALHCPDEAAARDRLEYHPGSGWRIPRGVELRAGGPGIDASIMAPLPLGDGISVRRDGAGGWDSSVTNWTLGDNWVQLVLHCVTKR